MLNNENLLNNIKKLCDEHNIKITNLEKALGFGAGIISRWGNGADPSLSKVIDIAEHFNISLDELVYKPQKDDENNNINDEFINSLILMTERNELTWEDILKIDDYYINNKPITNHFRIVSNADYEIYKSAYGDSFIFIVVQYVRRVNRYDYFDINVYIQGDVNSNPIAQSPASVKIMKDLWVAVRRLFYGIPDTVKAEAIKKQIIEESEQSTLDNFEKYLEKAPEVNASFDELLVDEKTKQILTEIDAPELQKLINIFTDPKMTQAINFTQKMITYFNDIKDAKEDK